MFYLILNNVPTHLWHENKYTDIDASDLQVIKRVGQSFYTLTFFILYRSTVIVVYLSFVIVNGNLLKWLTITAKLLQ